MMLKMIIIILIVITKKDYDHSENKYNNIDNGDCNNNTNVYNYDDNKYIDEDDNDHNNHECNYDNNDYENYGHKVDNNDDTQGSSTVPYPRAICLSIMKRKLYILHRGGTIDLASSVTH